MQIRWIVESLDCKTKTADVELYSDEETVKHIKLRLKLFEKIETTEKMEGHKSPKFALENRKRINDEKASCTYLKFKP